MIIEEFMKVSKQEFGTIDGQDVHLYTLENVNGMVVKVTSYGATITSVSIPCATGRKEIVCGFDTLEGYLSDEYRANAPYFGSTVGRFASRIKDGKFKIDGKEYKLATNDGPNHLHGGIKGFDKRIWDAEEFADEGEVGIRLSIESPDMEEGFPGKVLPRVTIILDNNNQLHFLYEAFTTQRTPISMTNHCYWNLSGFEETIHNHKAQVFAENYLKPDATNVPVGEIASVEGDPADLRKSKLFKDALNELPTGFEHYFVFDNRKDLRKVAAFEHQESGTSMTLSTTEPGMLFYSGYYTSDKLKRENGDRFGRYRGFCCETHRYPNGPNIPYSPGAFTHPDEKYESYTVFGFNWK